MFRRPAVLSFVPALLLFAGGTAHAGGLGGEANYAHADGRDGAELGAGYALSFQGFSLTPGAGLFIRDGGTQVYGRVEAAYTLPAALTLGVGVRIGDETRAYGTVAFPILPKVAIKGNLGDHYGAIGLKVGF
jgi:hypothetical protein